MTIFDLLFVCLVLITLVVLAYAAVAALRGRHAAAWAMVRRWSLCAAGYVAIVALVGALSPRRVIRPGEAWCFDDWCLDVENINTVSAPPYTVYRVALRIFSRARRVAQRAKGAWIYAVDQAGNRYAPDPEPSAVPLDVLLQAGESVNTERVFRVPAGAAEVGLATGHGPSYIPALIIGDEASLLHKRTLIRLR